MADKRVGLGCLRLETLKADSAEQCRNFDKAISVITDPFFQYNLTYYYCSGCVKSGPRSGASFWMMGPQQPPGNGIEFIRTEFEMDDYKISRFNLPPGSNVLDIGGNIGFFSVAVGHSFPGTKIVAVEAQPLNFLMLYHNLAINGLLDRVQPFNRALGKPGGSLTMSYQPMNPGGSQIISYKGGTAPGDDFQFDVLTMGFNQALAKLLASKPPHSNFTLKLDCEGCEYFVIDDVLGHEDEVADLRGETHDVRLAKPSEESIEKVLKFFKKHDPTYHPHRRLNEAKSWSTVSSIRLAKRSLI